MTYKLNENTKTSLIEIDKNVSLNILIKGVAKM